MKLSDFDYDLPPERIATRPARPRDSARLLHVARGGLHDRIVRDLPDLLAPGDALVVNDTKVIPAQLEGRRGNATIGITLDREMPDGTWHALLRNARRARPGETIAIASAEGMTAEVVSRDPDGSAQLRFNLTGAAFRAALGTAGHLALPPYIARDRGPTVEDSMDYQTIFAKDEGAVAAPTAGLHFTPELIARIEARGVSLVRVTLHVGAGTFLPVRGESIEEHRMHAERGAVSALAAEALNAARASGGRIVAVGTTSLRLLETAVDESGTIHPWSGETDIFIRPGYRFRAIDLLFTNFHLPRSTLLMLVAAFASHDRIRAAYDHAIAKEYRFYSYGDATLLEPA